eukprot:TRINITY_DN5004_c0_g1_i7.p1 TRINITY_DN5004_c0_g1~~TRINITY_DN5004_c0_g1_i7.p1  ORF type:complete len:485 (-),score=68.95 TRINITY_DN5004_c0_g1_i7:345-1799(-)
MLSNAQKRTAVKNFMKKTRDQGLMDLPSYLIMPVQRVPRYELLLREMLKFTPKTHPDHALVEKALEQVKKVASAINEKNREAESLNKMLDIQQSHPNIEILAAHRRYVRHGEFEQASRSSQLWRSTRILYLCNDSIIICFPRALNQDDIVIVSFESFAIFPVMSANATPVVRQVELYSPEISTYMGNAKSSLILETKENIAEWYDLVNVTARSWISNSYKIRGVHPIFTACGSSGDLVYVKYYTGLSDCDSISDSNGNTAVHIAAINGKIEIVQYLLDQGVSPNILNSAGQTPLHLSIRKKSIPCVVCCVERGAYINLPDRNGKTPLMHSFETKNEKISLYLSDNGARLISPQHIPEDLRVYLEKAIKTSADRYSSMNMLNHQRLQKSVDASAVLSTHIQNVARLAQEKKQRGEMSLCYLCATTPRLLKVYCFKCQALCCQKCSAKKMARPDQPRVVGQICDSCFNILTKHQTDSGSFSGAVPV